MKLTMEQCLRALGRLEAREPAARVARVFNVHEHTIRRLRNRHVQTGSVADRQRSGRPRGTSRRQDRQIVLTHLRDRFTVPANTARNTIGLGGCRISADTVRRRLRVSGIQCRRSYIGAKLTPNHRARRLNWARNHRRWRLAQWRNVLFTDEARFCVDSNDRRDHVYRRRRERFADACVRQRDRWGGVSTMVWGGVHSSGKTDIVFFKTARGRGLNAQSYVVNVLRPVVLPYVRARPGMILQQDNARPHTARHTPQFLNQQNVNVLPWPALSPDINPMEHVWDYMERRIRQQNVHNRQGLQRAILQEWNNLPLRFIRKLISSMPRRCRALEDARGGHTRY